MSYLPNVHLEEGFDRSLCLDTALFDHFYLLTL
jgi:hypothetical protein